MYYASAHSESSFRQLDDAFLQTQTRIWLGEVLQIRLDDQFIISELLADGELLFQMSRVMWKLLLEKHMELRNIKAYKTHPFSSRRNSGIYRPYSNVDSFLKICKIIGMTGVDLFTPSDVVERRNTRRVCICIRSFSKKLRSMNINVPDFDSVTCMVAMSKDMVGCIRRSIELSQSIIADTSSHHLEKQSRRKSSQGCLYDLNADDLYESDLIFKDFDQLDTQNQQRNDISNDEFKLLSKCSMESLEYCSDDIENEHDCKLTWPSSSSCGSLNVEVIGMTSHLDARVEQVQGSRFVDYDNFKHALFRNNASVIGTHANDRTSVMEATSYATNKKDSNMIGEVNSTPNVHQSASSHGSNTTPQSIESCRYFESFDVYDEMEVLQVADVSSFTREALNLGELFDAEDNVRNIDFFEVDDDKNDQWVKIKEYEAQDIMKCNGITSSTRSSYSVNNFEEMENSLYSPDSYFCNTNSSDRDVPNTDHISSPILKKSLTDEAMDSQVDSKCSDKASCNQSGECLACHSYYLPEFCKWDQKGKCAMTSNGVKDKQNSSCFLEDGSYKETGPCKQKDSEITMSKVMLPCAPSKEVIVSKGCAAAIKLGSDDKLNNSCLNLASDALGVEKCEKCPSDDDTNDSSGQGVTIQDIEDGSQKILDMITNDVVPITNCDEDVSHIECGKTNQSSILECNDTHQACQSYKDHIYHPEHADMVHTKEEVNSEDESVHAIEYLVETEEGGVEIPKSKPQKKLLLRSVLGGATAVGLLFMFLHLRRNGGEKDAQLSKTSSPKMKEKIQKHSIMTVNRISTTQEVYPAEKLRLK